MKTLLEAIRPTTILEPMKLSKLLGCEITIATETFQHTGSFKFRAAYNVAINVEQDEIIAASSGNFGQAMAYACQLTGKKCTIVMPSTSAKVKVDAVRAFGATADLVDTKVVSRSFRVAQLAEASPNAYIGSAYDDPLVIDGNSSLGDEIAELDFDIVVTPVGGGGLIAGLSLALCRNGHRASLIGAEPLLANDAARSLREGKILVNESEPTTIADGARTLSLGKHNWEIIKHGVSEIVEVSDENIRSAVKHLFTAANLKVEPTGALALGAILQNPALFKDKKVCVVASGGNVDPEIYRSMIAD